MWHNKILQNQGFIHINVWWVILLNIYSKSLSKLLSYVKINENNFFPNIKSKGNIFNYVFID